MLQVHLPSKESCSHHISFPHTANELVVKLLARQATARVRDMGPKLALVIAIRKTNQPIKVSLCSSWILLVTYCGIRFLFYLLVLLPASFLIKSSG